MDLAAEVLSLGEDGLMFDFVKSMTSTPGKGIAAHFDDKGVWYCTYDEPAVEAFKAKTGRDPFQIPNGDIDWVQFRADYMTGFVRKVREIQKRKYPNAKIGVFGCPRGRPGLATNDKMIPLADPLRAYLEDHDTWTRDGLIDQFVTAYGDFKGCPTGKRIRDLVSDSRSRVQLQVYKKDEECSMLRRAQAAKDSGCKEVVLFETTPIEAQKKWNLVRKAVDELG